MSMIETTDLERRISDKIDTGIAGSLSVSREGGGLAFRSATEAMEFAKMMAISQVGVRKHLRGNVGACLAIVVQAVEWGISPYAVANKSYLVNDQLAFESQLVQAVILRRAPIKGRFRFEFKGSGGKRVCRVVAALRDGGEVDYETPEFDKIPVKNSPLWKNDPDQQLTYYAGRALCRRHFPDVLLGIYDVDELPPIIEATAERIRENAPQSLNARLAAIATPAPVAEIDHDPETGEIIDQDSAAVAPATSAAADEGAGEVRSPASPAPANSEWFERGALAAREGLGRKAVPGELRGADHAAEAKEWLRGHDSVTAEEGR